MKYFIVFLRIFFSYYLLYIRIFSDFSAFIPIFTLYVHFYLLQNITFLRTVFSYDYFLFRKVYISLFVIFLHIRISRAKAGKEADSD